MGRRAIEMLLGKVSDEASDLISDHTNDRILLPSAHRLDRYSCKTFQRLIPTLSEQARTVDIG